MNEVRNLLVGMEITRETAELSCFDRTLKEPTLIPVKVGSGQSRFPLELVKMRGRDEWHFGLEAHFFGTKEDGITVPDLFGILMAGQKVTVDDTEMEPYELLGIYIRESLCLIGVPRPVSSIAGICVTCPEMGVISPVTVMKALIFAGFKENQCFVSDHSECFYYYAYSLKAELRGRGSGMGLVTFYGNTAAMSLLTEKRDTKPFAVSMGETVSVELPPEDDDQRDASFAEAVRNWTEGTLLSGIFITGEGFDTAWAVESVKVLSKAAAHVYAEDSLFVKGACCAAAARLEKHGLENYMYFGPDTVRCTVGMDVIEGGQQRFLPLIQAGSSCYTPAAYIEVILDGRDELLVTVRPYDRSSHKNERIELDGLPERPARATRLGITAGAESADEYVIKAEDLGFGELYPATHKVWEMRVSAGSEET